jgi:hypothetical protein
MNYTWILALQMSFFGFAPAAFPQALEETTALLNNPVARGAVIQGDPKAQAADDQVKGLGLGAAGEAKVYELAGKILEKIASDGGGDSDKMMEQVQALVRNPASLEEKLTPDQKAQIHTLAGESDPNQTKK